MLIPCPYCGPRASDEFTYLGDASVKRPSPKADAERWYAYVYERKNPMGMHREYWQHTGGCRAWVVVERNTLTHEVKASRVAQVTSRGKA